ncbi:unnamed protein product [Closterium sp. Naga37s-1]|nr:unnamed protein product [Closterium sp. Naga37s-1]
MGAGMNLQSMQGNVALDGRWVLHSLLTQASSQPTSHHLPFLTHTSSISSPALLACPPHLPSSPALLTCPPHLPSSPALLTCLCPPHLPLPSSPALLTCLCPPHLPSSPASALLTCPPHLPLPSSPALLTCLCITSHNLLSHHPLLTFPSSHIIHLLTCLCQQQCHAQMRGSRRGNGSSVAGERSEAGGAMGAGMGLESMQQGVHSRHMHARWLECSSVAGERAEAGGAMGAGMGLQSMQ